MKGKVYWVTGYSGAGKTTVGNKLYSLIRNRGTPCVHLDGDTLRKIVANEEYDYASRLKLAKLYSGLCKLISDQSIDVVCSTVSMFNCIRDLNRSSIENYIEIYLRVTQQTLMERNQKGIYTDYFHGVINDVVGLDLVLEEPTNPDLIFDNDGRIPVEEIVEKILNYSEVTYENRMEL